MAAYQRRVMITLGAGADIIHRHGLGREPDKVSVSRIEGDAYLQFDDWTGTTVRISNPGTLVNRSDIVFEKVHSVVH